LSSVCDVYCDIGIKLDDNVDFEHLVKNTEGYSGADIASVRGYLNVKANGIRCAERLQ
jgi:ATP-dependent 26S proteasome regulatory subunit